MTLKNMTERAETWLDTVKNRFRGGGASEVVVTQRQEDREQLSDRPCASPPVDIFEDEGRLMLVADVPGATRRSIDVRWDGEQLLTFHARADEAQPFCRSDWYRSFTLPNAYRGKDAKAHIKDGVLTIEVPRRSTATPKRIAVRAGP